MKMQDGNTCIPLYTVEDVRRAERLGYRIEYTACGDDRYGMPTSDKSGSGGWVREQTSPARWDGWFDAEMTHRKTRAILPANVQPERPRRLTRLVTAFTRLFS